MKQPSVIQMIERACNTFCMEYCKYQKEFEGVETDEEYNKKQTNFARVVRCLTLIKEWGK